MLSIQRKKKRPSLTNYSRRLHSLIMTAWLRSATSQSSASKSKRKSSISSSRSRPKKSWCPLSPTRSVSSLNCYSSNSHVPSACCRRWSAPASSSKWRTHWSSVGLTPWKLFSCSLPSRKSPRKTTFSTRWSTLTQSGCMATDSPFWQAWSKSTWTSSGR